MNEYNRRKKKLDEDTLRQVENQMDIIRFQKNLKEEDNEDFIERELDKDMVKEYDENVQKERQKILDQQYKERFGVNDAICVFNKPVQTTGSAFDRENSQFRKRVKDSTYTREEIADLELNK